MDDVVKLIGSSSEGLWEERAVDRLREIASLPHVVTPCIALPDLHYKEKMEAPSSIGVGVDRHIIPHLSSTSLNCGMGVIATSLIADRSFMERLDEFFYQFRMRKDETKYNLTKNELYDILKLGPRGVCEKFGVEKSIINSFELAGNALSNNPYCHEGILNLIPNSVLDHPKYSGRTGLGTGFGGNHFLEIQRVDKIYDKESARAARITGIGQVVVMYHGGGGVIPGFLGAYFSRRKKGFDDGFRTNARRLFYHLIRSKRSDVFNLYRLYLENRQFASFYEESQQGQRLIMANACSMNYGYAYRFFTYLRVRDILVDLFGVSAGEVFCVTDRSHNSILHETIDGLPLWMHRHNSCSVSKDSLIPLPGHNTTSSFICLGGSGSSVSLNTMPHGAGAVIEAFQARGVLSPINRTTQIYSGNAAIPIEKKHISDAAVNEVVQSLVDLDIARPVVGMTPLAVLKNFV